MVLSLRDGQWVVDRKHAMIFASPVAPSNGEQRDAMV